MALNRSKHGDNDEGVIGDVMAELGDPSGSQRRRSARLTSPLHQANVSQNASDKMALPAAAVKRSITVRKIAPRKTVAPSDENKENAPRPSEGSQQKKAKVSTPGNVTSHGRSSSAKKKAVMPSPILPSTPPPTAPAQQPAVDPDDEVWSQKVRRSYSRLSEKSLNSPHSRETLFGFDNLQTPEVVRPAGRSKAGLEVSGSLVGLNSFSSLLEGEDCGSTVPELDPNIPGVVAVKEKKRRRKVQHIDQSEVDAIAAKMNAEFEEAEEFELLVE